MSLKVIILLLTGIIGIGGLILFQTIGSTIDGEGILREPFYLVPVSYILIVLGFGGAAFILLRRLIRG